MDFKKLVKNLYLLLFLLTPLIFSSTNSEYFELPKMYFIYLVSLVIFSAHFANYLQGKSPLIVRTPLNVFLFVFLGTQLLSTFFSIDSHTSFYGYYSRLNGGLLSLFIFALLYLVLVIYIDDKFKTNIIRVSLISGALVAFIGILQHFHPTQYSWVQSFMSSPILLPLYSLIHPGFWKQDVVNRVFSSFGQPNWLAAYLCILLPFALDKALSSKNIFPQITYYGLLITYYVCLLFTKSKSGIIAAIVSISIYFLIKIISDYKKNVLFINHKSYIISLSVFLLLTCLIRNPLRDYFSPKANNPPADSEPANNLNITPSEDIRKIVWRGSIELWRQFPVFGTGPETFAYSYYWTRPSEHNLTSEWNFLYNKAHNEYLNYLATTGTLGLLSYILLICSITYYGLRVTDYNKKLVLFSSFLSILITNSVGFSVAVTSLYFFLLPAFTFARQSEDRLLHPKPKFYLLFLLLFIVYLSSKLMFYFLADIAYAKANSLDSTQQYRQALDNIRLSVTYRPSEPVYLSKLADLSAKAALLDQHDKQSEAMDQNVLAAVKAADRSLQISPFNLNLWKERAQTYYYLSGVDSKYYLDALDSLTKATKLAPTDAMSFYLLGKFYQNINETDKAIENYQKALELKSNYDWAAFSLGKIYFDQKQFDLAKPLFEKTLQIAPSNSDAINYLTLIATASAGKK